MDMSSNRAKPLVLCILDGFGERDIVEDNAVAGAKSPFLRKLRANYPMSLLDASEEYVGLPKGQMGNSEVGHTAIGAGRVVLQDLPRIDHAITDSSLENNPIIQNSINALKASGKALHLLGLLSNGGVHSHINHLIALANIYSKAGIKVWAHLWSDGRDTPPKSAVAFLNEFTQAASKAQIATISGRFYAMDRDKRWERLVLSYDAMVMGQSDSTAKHGLEAIQQAYDQGKTDEFILPTVLEGYKGMEDGDAILIANFRADRVREISAALFTPHFKDFVRARIPNFSAKIAMAEYESSLKPFMEVLFPSFFPANTLGETIAKAGMRQLRIAETEKYAHVTYFFNGGVEDNFKGEDRILVPSPKIATYDLQPEMSANEVTQKLETVIQQGLYDVIIVNFANPDMVGHTGDYHAAVMAIEAIDHALAQIVPLILEQKGIICITADHGNAEMMKDPLTHEPHTAHTLEKVPFIMVGADPKLGLTNGCLVDIAPTMLCLLGLKVPDEMTGHSLLQG